MRYASADNFLKAAVYPGCARCLLREEAAAALGRVQASLEADGLGLLMWDCYRPPAVQQAMGKIVPGGAGRSGERDRDKNRARLRAAMEAEGFIQRGGLQRVADRRKTALRRVNTRPSMRR